MAQSIKRWFIDSVFLSVFLPFYGIFRRRLSFLGSGFTNLLCIFVRVKRGIMKEKINKTNAVRLLDKAKIAYELIPYEVDEHDLAAAHVAAQLGENIEQVFKTLVLHGDRNGYFVCVIPGNHGSRFEVGGEGIGKQESRSDSDERIASVTGYIRGGCSPVGMKKSSRRLFTIRACNLNIYLSVRE